MQNLHPDHFKVEWSRILIAAGIEPISIVALGKAIEKEFNKRYYLEHLSLWLDDLATRGLIEFVGSDIQVTMVGIELVGMIHYLSRTQPDPYRRLTRPSYSPNCGTHTPEGTRRVQVSADGLTW